MARKTNGFRVAVVGAVFSWAFACILSFGSELAVAFIPLPDGRAWEMVSPLAKNGGDVLGGGAFGEGGIVQASADGASITYIAQSSFVEPDPSGAVANQYISRRMPEGWTVQNITTPADAGTYGQAGTGTPYKAFSPDLSLGLLLNGEAGGEAAIDNPPLVSTPEAPAGYQNFYLRTGTDGSLQPLLGYIPVVPASEFYMYLQGASPDLTHMVVLSDAELTSPGAVAEGDRRDLYEWTNGQWSAVNVLPAEKGGVTVPDAQLGSGLGESGTVSTNGSHIFWSYGVNNTAALYVRNEGTETVQIDAPKSGPGVGEKENPFPQFRIATPDGLHAFFTSHSPLTGDANTGPPCGSFCKRAGNDLYEFNVQTGSLKDISPDHLPIDKAGAKVQGVIGVSEDGTSVYFVAKGVLSGVNSAGREPSDNSPNVYIWHEDPVTHAYTTNFIATMSPGDEGPSGESQVAHDWSPEIVKRTARVTPDGSHMIFMAQESLTGYDNADAVTGELDEEVYLYNAESEKLICVSCNSTGARPLGSSSIPGGIPFEHRLNGGSLYQSRALSEDGSYVLFDSNDALVPQDTNGRQDVYEYAHGHAYLISGGTSSDASEFVDASNDGSDVFFLTRQQLVSRDSDQLVDLYDARVGGGTAEPVAVPPCIEEKCRPPKSLTPSFGTPASEVFAGSGNLPSSVAKPVARAKTKKRRHISIKRHKGKARAGSHKVRHSSLARRAGALRRRA